MVFPHISSDHFLNYLLRSCHANDKPSSITFFNYLNHGLKKMIVNDLCHLSNVDLSDHDWLEQHGFEDLSKVAIVADRCAKDFFASMPQAPKCERIIQMLQHAVVGDDPIDQRNKEDQKTNALFDSKFTFPEKVDFSLEEFFLHQPFLLKYEENKHIVLKVIALDGWTIKYVNDLLKNDKDVATAAMQKTYGLVFQFVGDSLKKDKDFVRAMIIDHKYRFALEFIHDDLKNDKELMLSVLALDGLSLKYISVQLQNDKDLVLLAVTQNGMALEFASEELQNDRDVVWAAVSKNGEALRFASAQLQNDKDVVIKAASVFEEALQYASQDLRSDKTFILDNISKFRSILKFATRELKCDRDVVFAAVRKNGLSLRFAIEELRKDREVILAAVNQNGMALEFADDVFKNDPEIVLVAVDKCKSGRSFNFASSLLRNNKEFVLDVVSRNGLAIEYASKSFHSDKDVVLRASSQNGEAFQYASSFLQHDMGLIHQIFSNNPSFFSEIEEEKKAKYFMKLVYFHVADELETDQLAELREQLVSCSNEDLQEFFLHRLILTSKEHLKSLFCNQVFTSTQSNDLRLLLLVIESLPIDSKVKYEFFHQIKIHYKSLFKDRIKRDQLFHCFSSICMDKVNFSHTCGRLLAAMRQNNKAALLHCILMLTVLTKEMPEKMIALQDHEMIPDTLANILLGDLQMHGMLMEGRENLTRAASIFLNYRNPASLLSYAFHSVTSRRMKMAIFHFTRSVMEGTFIAERYEKSPNIQMLSSDKKRMWMTPLEKEEVLKTGDEESFELHKFFYEKLVIDGHGKDRFKKIISHLKNEGADTHNMDDVELALISLFSMDQDQLLVGFKRLYKLLKAPEYQGLELINDIHGLIETFEKQKSSSKVYLVDSDDHEDLFLCGTEVPGSCQRIDGDPFLNRCLMGYVLDGKVRLLAIKNQAGVIISRVILKLLYDENKNPVLFIERVYGDMHYRSSLEMYAKKKARSMNIPLFSSGKGSNLHSFGNVAPFEYEDGGVGISKGQYNICAKKILD